MKKLLMFFDGACDNNSKLKLMGAGVAVFLNQQNESSRVRELDIAKLVGVSGTSNMCEYLALLEALKMANNLKRGLSTIKGLKVDDYEFHFFGDSQLIVNQVKGDWQCKNEVLKDFRDECLEEIQNLGQSYKGISWVRRKFNKEADELSKKAIVDYIEQIV